MNVEIKSHYTAKELASLNLRSLPTSHCNVRAKLEAEKVQSRPRSGRGGGVEYAFDSLPADVQAEIKAKHIRAMLPKVEKPSVPALIERDLADLTDVQRATADARLLMALLVAQFELELGGRTVAIQHISDLSRNNALPVIDGTDYNQVCATALAKKSRTGAKVGVGVRKLHEWCLLETRCSTPSERLKMFAPQKQGQPVIATTDLPWLGDFMAIYRHANNLSVTRAYERFCLDYVAKHGLEQKIPSLTQVRLALDKLPPYVREKGRLTGSRLRQLRSYVKRDWNPDWVMANDVWVGDGHLLKMQVRHPIHGQAFAPELTLVMDASSRLIVGWSLALSENHMAVIDALRMAMVLHGIPAIYYSDNGGGQKNKVLDGDAEYGFQQITGILPRLGVTHAFGIPGNPQGRAIIERAMQEVPSRVAQRFETFFGRNADDETVRKHMVAVRSYSRAIAQQKDELTPLQQKGEKILPTWHALLAVIAEEVERYNTSHEHSGIGYRTPMQMREKMLKELEQQGGELVPLSELEARDIFRPAVMRKVHRALVDYENGEYYHRDLEPLHGQMVLVLIDIYDPSKVIVREQSGRFICEAELNGHKRDAFPMSYVDKARETRAKGRISRSEDKIAEAKAELRTLYEQKNSEHLLECADESDVELIGVSTYDPFKGFDVEIIENVG